jgi:septal ring factor EnvC (AmiA/AmiB activator)
MYRLFLFLTASLSLAGCFQPFTSRLDETNARLAQVTEQLDETNRRLARIDRSVDATNEKLGTVEKAVKQIPGFKL